jgi:hypothetical protein
MAQPYSEQTQKILDDFLDALGESVDIDSAFLAELREMAHSGTLDDRNRIQQAVTDLEGRANVLYHR